MVSQAKPPRTTRDALIIEAIGDIGELMIQLEQLNQTLAPMVSALQQAQEAALTAVDCYTDKQKQHLLLCSKQQQAELVDCLQSAVTQAARALEGAGERMAEELPQPNGLSYWKQIIIVIAIASVTSLMSIYGAYRVFGQALDSQAAIGRAVITVWEQLDDKAKKLIEQAF